MKLDAIEFKVQAREYLSENKEYSLQALEFSATENNDFLELCRGHIKGKLNLSLKYDYLNQICLTSFSSLEGISRIVRMWENKNWLYIATKIYHKAVIIEFENASYSKAKFSPRLTIYSSDQIRHKDFFNKFYYQNDIRFNTEIFKCRKILFENFLNSGDSLNSNPLKKNNVRQLYPQRIKDYELLKS